MANDIERILEIVQDVRETQRCMVPKLDDVRTKVTGHLAWHRGQETAEARAATAGARTVARVGAAGTWVKAAIAGLAILVAAVVFVASGLGAVGREPADEVRELNGRLDKVIQQLDRLSREKPGRGPS